MKPLISVSLPSLDPSAESIMRILKHSFGPDAVQVIVVGPKEPPILDHTSLWGVRWVEETEPRGIAAAHRVALDYAEGQFIVAFADDHAFMPSWDLQAAEAFWVQETRCVARPFCLGLRGAHSAHVGTEFGIYYPYFPMMRTVAAREIGWFSADYRSGFSDSDLAMRVWAAGGRCEWTDQGLLYPLPADKAKVVAPGHRPEANYTDQDMALFLARWAGRYGAGWDTSRIDGFNVDLRPEQNPQLVQHNSIHFNDAPGFFGRLQRMT